MHHVFPKRFEEHWSKLEKSFLLPLCRDCHNNLEYLILLLEFDEKVRVLHRLPGWCYWEIIKFFLRDDVNESVIKALFVRRGWKPNRPIEGYPEVELSDRILKNFQSIETKARQKRVFGKKIIHSVRLLNEANE